ncbi:hypothetical protein [Thalassospira lucentensis]|uniref:hypothetical protein n=1 Tax=Thalassospira lucentensis TaxID=168935 RepID=UPI00142DF931|nr:hypothetical protein [Thalassospira lucentensis]NIZ01301.1 hypothetical protein [Thalassospira lucentensis]
MSISRTTHTTVTFAHPFRLPGYETDFPAGTYGIDTTEDLIEGLSFMAYQRVSTDLHYRTEKGVPFVEKIFSIAPSALDAVLAKDKDKDTKQKSAAQISDGA